MAQLTAHQRLVKYGFIQKKFRDLYELDDKAKVWKPRKGDYVGDHADEELAEEVNIQAEIEKGYSTYFKTGFPAPAKRYRLLYESFGASIEETYYWVLSHLQQDLSFYKVHKIIDIYSAAAP